jgi:pilus assembly protein CpaE
MSARILPRNRERRDPAPAADRSRSEGRAAQSSTDRDPSNQARALGRVHAFYGAKGGVGTTTLAINTAIALHRDQGKAVALVDGNLHFGDHRMFLDLGPDKRSIVDAVGQGGIDQEVVRRVTVLHKSGLDLVLAPTTPEAAEEVKTESHDLLQVCVQLRSMYDYVVVDLDQQLDDHTLDIIALADTLFVVMTADLPSIKNVRLVLDTMSLLGVPDERMELVLNRSNAFTGISVKSAESALKRQIVHQVVNDYRTAISSLNSGTPFMIARRDSAIGKAVRAFAAAISESEPSTARVPAAGFVPAFG